MKIKSVITGASVVAISALALAGCGSSSSSSSSSSSKKSSSSSSAKTTKVAKLTAGSKMKAGTYALEEQNYSHGYRTKMSITVNNKGKITKSSYDQVNKNGKSKVDDTSYNKQMKKIAGTNPKTYMPKLNKTLTGSAATGNVGSIDVVTGATESSKTFQNYTQQLVQAAQAGNKSTIKIDNGAKMKDGTYKLNEKNYSHGYKVTFAITVKDNKIIKSEYNQVNKNGKSKVDDAAYNKQMKKVAKTNPKTYQPALNKSLVKSSDPTKVDVVTGATESSNTFILYAEQLQNAAQKGDTNTITVDNMIFSE
ncbi:FMN-binding protein [Lactiplantibacillus pentosus]|uniref:Lipoprotein n=1 Tax=Lactiplantibacillus pentosus IG1 TaxID=1042160 RepID=G0M280_LACPE|nr:extracellular electron transfer flavoprotein PplA [Lactiplantibacillus pentosus]CCC16164.1 lipoprotein [Lactiplantibacillus pentosus IG1]MCT3303100.1 FMN-binding protein [Lactiplantibacillus pentosus]PRO76768.1 FMN-binding protein [Lactiplantibacillus pentosus]PRO78674.1 FMN-binding protein [Lactiplantibacillus pentosus]PRO87884.1 FMN-binding protein [Lactiplantibacillus pentosus]